VSVCVEPTEALTALVIVIVVSVPEAPATVMGKNRYVLFGKNVTVPVVVVPLGE
jgi:hypothetical protein